LHWESETCAIDGHTGLTPLAGFRFHGMGCWSPRGTEPIRKNEHIDILGDELESPEACG